MSEQGSSFVDVLSVATLTSLHGIRGELKVRCEAEMLEVLRAAAQDAWPVTLRLPETGDEYEVTLGSVRGHASAPIVAIDGVERREEAQEYRGAVICIARELIPPPEEGEFFLADLQGCVAHRAPAGDRIGSVTRAQSFPANVVLTVSLDAGGELLVPFIDAAVPVVEVEERRIELDCAFLGVDDDAQEPG